MKTTQRLCLGLISSLLLSAGLSHAAQRLDPLTQHFATTEIQADCSPAPATACTMPCNYAPRPANVQKSNLR